MLYLFEQDLDKKVCNMFKQAYNGFTWSLAAQQMSQC